MTLKLLIIVAITMLLASCQLQQGSNNIYLSPKGADANSGSKSKPLKTLTVSLDAIRNLRKQNLVLYLKSADK